MSELTLSVCNNRFAFSSTGIEFYCKKALRFGFQIQILMLRFKISLKLLSKAENMKFREVHEIILPPRLEERKNYSHEMLIDFSKSNFIMRFVVSKLHASLRVLLTCLSPPNSSTEFFDHATSFKF